MHYYALVLETDNFIEKCIYLLRFICRPSSYSQPHITLRLFRGENDRIQDYCNSQVTYLNIIEPEAFNQNDKKKPTVVFLRCESEELEIYEYKPDYPYSRLHITLYEGNDLDFADIIISQLKRINWPQKIVFNKNRKLIKSKVGTKLSQKDFHGIIGPIYREILDEDIKGFDEKNKIDLLIKVVNKIIDYLSTDTSYRNAPENYVSPSHNKSVIDESENNISAQYQQLSFDNDTVVNNYVEKPVQDAIFVTPPEYAKDMACCALRFFKESEINFGDSAIGTGALFLSFYHLIKNLNEKESAIKYKFNSAIGIDIEKNLANEAFTKCHSRGLSVIYGDALSSDLTLSTDRNIMLVNPPYNRYEDIPEEYRSKIAEYAKNQTGIDVPKRAGLYVYHLLIMDKWLQPSGIGVWLIPTIFLQSNYGKALRVYLTSKVNLLMMHIYEDAKIQFERTNISTTIVVFEKSNISNKNNEIPISYGDSVEKPKQQYFVNNGVLLENINNWRKAIFSKRIKINSLDKTNITFSNLFTIKRGIATGANSFFVLERHKAAMLQIPQVVLKPVLPKARYLTSQIVNAKSDGYPDVSPELVLIDTSLELNYIKTQYPSFYDYLLTADSDNKGIFVTKRTLVSSRSPWYSQEKRLPPPFLLTYMGRNKEKLPPLYFIRNKSDAVALNTYILLYPNDWLQNLLDLDNRLYDQLFESLNYTAECLIEEQSRVYSGGLHKIEPSELKSMNVYKLPEVILTEYYSQ